MVKLSFIVGATVMYMAATAFGKDSGTISGIDSIKSKNLDDETYVCPVGCTGSGDSCAASPIATITQALKCGGSNYGTVNGVSYYDCASLGFQTASFSATSGYDSSWLSGCQLSYTNPGCTAKVCYGTVTNTSADSCPSYNNFVFVCQKSKTACGLDPFNVNAPVSGKLTICLGDVALNLIEEPNKA